MFFLKILLANFRKILTCKFVTSTNTEAFSWEKKWSKFAKFRKLKKFKSPDFYNDFQQVVAKNIERSWFFFYFHVWHVARIG